MTVALKAKNTSYTFNLTPPAADTAIHIGSSAGDTFSAPLPASGTYRAQVYLMRTASPRP